MDTDVVEVVARFGDTILDVTHVGLTDTYRIGTAPGTNLVVPGLVSFPLVAGGNVRCPVGLVSRERDGSTELRSGELTLTLTRAKLRRAALARPRIDHRAPAFLLLSLVAHIAVWLVAMITAPFEQLPRTKPRPRLVHIPNAPMPPDPKPPVRKQESATGAQPARVARVARTSRAAASEATHVDVGTVTRSLMKQLDEIDVAGKLAELRPEDTYNEDEANSRGFGGGRRFDPSQREGFGSIESGPYEMMPFDVKLCPEKSCTVEGPIPALFIRTHLHSHMTEIYDCYMRYASGPGTIVLEFTITPDGAVRDARGSGLGETGACAARVAGEIYFKALGLDFDPPTETHVRYPLRFNPNRG
ncbi:MAG TPA: hypothetical protein VIV40_21415 [Kofleriaceae bacterium]